MFRRTKRLHPMPINWDNFYACQWCCCLVLSAEGAKHFTVCPGAPTGSRERNAHA